MNKIIMMRIAVMLTGLALAGNVFGAWATDDFESNSFSGGSGNWTTDWIHSGAGGSFLNGGSEIDGVFAGALFTGGGGVSVLSRSFETLDSGTVSASWSIKGLNNMFQIGVNLIGSMSNSASNIVTLKFDSSNTGLRMNDGGSDFTATTDVTYSNNAIFDFTFTSTVGSNEYFWSVAQRGGNSASNSLAFTYSGGATLSELNQIVFFWDAPGGAGNDGMIDSVTVIPEPSSIIMMGLAGLAAGGLTVLKRRKCA